MSERPDKERRKELRDQYKAAHPDTPGGGWRGMWPVLLWMLPVLIVAGFALGVIMAASGLLMDGVFLDLWRRGRIVDLLWVGVGSLVGAGLVYLWMTRVSKKKAGLQYFLWGGAIAGAACVAPTAVADAVLPPAVVYGGLFLIACAAAMAGMLWALYSPSAFSCIAGGGLAGGVMGATLWLCTRILDISEQMPHGNLGAAFTFLFTGLAEEAVDLWTLISAIVLAFLGALALWHLTAETRAAGAADLDAG